MSILTREKKRANADRKESGVSQKSPKNTSRYSLAEGTSNGRRENQEKKGSG